VASLTTCKFVTGLGADCREVSRCTTLVGCVRVFSGPAGTELAFVATLPEVACSTIDADVLISGASLTSFFERALYVAGVVVQESDTGLLISVS